MRHFVILCTVLALTASSVVLAAAEEKKDQAATCTVVDGKVVCNKEACDKDCENCPDKDTCTKACAADGAKACPADCDKACCETVVTVNGVKITEGQIAKELEKRIKGQSMQMPPGQEIPEAYKQQMRQQVLKMKVDQTLMDQELAKKNIKVTDDQVVAEIKTIAAGQGQTLEDVEKQIADFGMTMDDLKEQVGYQVKMKALMKAEMKDAAEVKEEDAKKFYDDNPQYFEQKEQVKASHILCGKRGITEEEYEAELVKIKEVQAKLKEGGKFEDLAKEYSTCPSSANGGDLGFFGKGQMDPAFETAAFETKVGETTDIVKTSFGYHLIKVTDKKEAGKTPFADVETKITQHLETQKQQQFWAGYSPKMTEAAKIEYSEAEQARKEAAEAAQAAMQQQRQQQMMQQMQQQQQAAPQEK